MKKSQSNDKKELVTEQLLEEYKKGRTLMGEMYTEPRCVGEAISITYAEYPLKNFDETLFDEETIHWIHLVSSVPAREEARKAIAEMS